ncbi:hypothetical protein BBJ28_00001603 [Nothophytophthora sp. Chile5]|nr:hypothetical protein BBJ28_00001603 [Nothophytophthora sp. Chile5]
MPFAGIARFFGFASSKRRRDHAAQRRHQRRGSSRRVHGTTTRSGIVQVPEMEAMTVDFDMSSQMSMSTRGARLALLELSESSMSMNSARSRRGMDAVVVAKHDQKKLKKALDRAMRQERKEARKMKKHSDKLAKKRGSNKRLALLSTETVAECDEDSTREMLAQIWALRSSSCDRFMEEDMPEVDGEFSESPHMEFLFYAGCPDDKNLHELDVGNRRLRSNPRAARYPSTPSYAKTIPIRPSLVSNMPPLFVPRFDAFDG